MASKRVTIHSSLLFDPKTKEFTKNRTIVVDCATGSIADVFERESDDKIHDGDIDLRGKTVMPGFVDSHTHIFLHSYELSRPVSSLLFLSIHQASWGLSPPWRGCNRLVRAKRLAGDVC